MGINTLQNSTGPSGGLRFIPSFSSAWFEVEPKVPITGHSAHGTLHFHVLNQAASCETAVYGNNVFSKFYVASIISDRQMLAPVPVSLQPEATEYLYSLLQRIVNRHQQLRKSTNDNTSQASHDHIFVVLLSSSASQCLKPEVSLSWLEQRPK
jgi:hypothetical protein